MPEKSAPVFMHFSLKCVSSQLYLSFIFDAELMSQLIACDADRRICSEKPQLPPAGFSLTQSFHLGFPTEKSALQPTGNAPGAPDG